MKTTMQHKTIIIKGLLTFCLAVVLLGVHDLSARNHKVDSLVRRGDNLRNAYQFEASLSAYANALEMLKDSAGNYIDSSYIDISDKQLLSENGKNMSAFVSNPKVVAKHMFSLSDFYLYYPLPDESWRIVPNQLDTLAGHKFSKAIYHPENENVIYYSAVDESGVRNIYKTELLDTIWSAPSLLNEQMTSFSDEIYPMLSSDGKSLVFASAGLYGVGGYDLYISTWDEEVADWSTPVNMGFPYSSPANDFLLINTDDGKYTIFASDRDCPSDSVCVYVLEYDSMPVRKPVYEPQELVNLSKLTPADTDEDNSLDVNADIPENIDTKRYMDKMSEVRTLRDSLAVYEAMLEENRNLFILSSDADERISLTNKILNLESSMPYIQDSLAKATDILRQIELEFLFNGVVIDPDKLMAAADREFVGESSGYTFVKMAMGKQLNMNILPPPVKFDYTFKVLDEGQFALDNTLPEGLVYQIQIFSLNQKATVKSLRGLSPVFERKTASGRYVYRVGLFKTYKDVLAKLNIVKKVGFRNAFIVAFDSGKEMQVSKARALEKKLKEKPVFYQVRLTPNGGDLDAAATAGISQQAGGKDIAKTEDENGGVLYVIGPYADKAAAESLVSFINAMGIGKVELRNINN